MMGAVNLPDETLTLIQTTIASYGGIKKAAVFGSRAKGTNRRYSDVDIALWGDVTARDARRIRGDLEELPTVYEYDVLAYDDVNNEALKEHIDRVGVVIYEKE